MPGTDLLLTLAQIAIVTAGFAGLTGALRQESSGWTAVHGLRVQRLLAASFIQVLYALLPVLLFYIGVDARRAIDEASAVACLSGVVMSAVRVRGALPAAGFWSADNLWVFVLAPAFAIIIYAINALVWHSSGAYAAGVVMTLSGVFVNFYGLVVMTTTARPID
ncbi:MAG: hypothetical protein JO023_29010 [Chloroflexi bacterium]|nr:hypothetical protein [Chloroflexota bacterium]